MAARSGRRQSSGDDIETTLNPMISSAADISSIVAASTRTAHRCIAGMTSALPRLSVYGSGLRHRRFVCHGLATPHGVFVMRLLQGEPYRTCTSHVYGIDRRNHSCHQQQRSTLYAEVMMK